MSSYRALALVPVLLALSACAAARDAGIPVMSASRLGESVALEGKAIAPAGLLSNNSAGLIGNNAAGLIGNNAAGIVASNSGRYVLSPAFSLLALDEAPLANALAYLTDPKEQFYKANGRMITAMTDGQGRYRFNAGVPKDVPVIVNVILPGNQRVVGFTVPETGSNRLDVSASTTYVTEFLRERADMAKKSMAAYDLAKLPDLAKRTAAAISADELAVPDLRIGKIADLNNAYALAVGQNLQGLGDAWAALLGTRTVAAVTVAGSGVSDDGGDGKPALKGEFYRMKGVCVDRAGHVYLADEGNHRVRKIDAQTGLLSTIAGTGQRGYGGDGGPGVDAALNHPRAVVLDRGEGSLFIFDSQNVRVRKLDLRTGIITTVAGDPAPRGEGFWQSGHGGDGGPAVKAQLFSPRGGAVDSQGNLYVVDGLKGTKFHTIRKITPAGVISTFAGVPDQEGAFAGENVPAENAKLNYTNQIWITPDDQLLLADTFNNVVRKIDLRTRLITTIAGVPGRQASAPEPDGKPATETALNGPYGVAQDAKGQIFVSERGHGRLLVIKADGKMHTVAGGGASVGEGDARRLSFSEPHDLFVEADGNVLITDTRNARLRRIVTKFGL